MSLFKKKSHETHNAAPNNEIIDNFLMHDYLDNEYVIPGHVDTALRDASYELADVSGFVGVVNVGGTANGSYALRLQTDKRVTTDLDFYVVGDGQLDLDGVSDTVTAHARNAGIEPDGELNGRKLDNYLDLSMVDEIIDRGDAPLLALVFQSFYGNDVKTAQRTVLESIIKRDDAQKVWDEVASFHSQSLSLHHGSFPQERSQDILDNYYPLKIDKFQLPMTPIEALNAINV